MNLFIEKFSPENEDKWDDFILKDSVNGTFLNSRKFLNYHKDKYNDHSLFIKKGENIVALIPACEIVENKKRVLYSHKGSTFGGVIINKIYNNIDHIDNVIRIFEQYLKEQGFDKIVLKSTSDIFSKDNASLLDYFYFKYDYKSYSELSLIIDLNKYDSIIEKNFSASKRRDLKYSFKYNLKFNELETNEEIINFYKLLVISLKKHNTKPVHLLEELLDLKNKILTDVVRFYGVYYGNKLIAGSMIFNFNNSVFHTQYLASNPDYSSYYPMNFLNYNLINQAYSKKFKFFSFGINTEDKGKRLNTSLAQFKEGFGASGSINRTYYKELN